MPLDPKWPSSKLSAVLEEARPVLILWADTESGGKHCNDIHLQEHTDAGCAADICADDLYLCFNM